MIKALLIDIDNTIIDFGKSSALAMKLSFEERGLCYNDTVYTVFHQVNDGLWQQIEQKTFAKERLREVRWNLIFERLGIDADGEEFELIFKKYLAKCAEKVDGAEEMLSYLKGKYILCAASNGPHFEQFSRLEECGLLQYFDHVCVSEDAGADKPDEKFFEYCMSKLCGISRNEVMIIGDSLSADIRGGKRFGLKTCFFDFKKQGNITSGSADMMIKDLCEVRDIL